MRRRSLLKGVIGGGASLAGGPILAGPRDGRPLVVGLGGAGCNVLHSLVEDPPPGAVTLAIDREAHGAATAGARVCSAHFDQAAARVLAKRHGRISAVLGLGGRGFRRRTGVQIAGRLFAAALESATPVSALVLTPFPWEAGRPGDRQAWLARWRSRGVEIQVLDNGTLLESVPRGSTLGDGFRAINAAAARRLAVLPG